MTQQTNYANDASLLTKDQITALKYSLAWLFSKPEDIRTLSNSVGLSPDATKEGAKPIEVWEGILKQAANRGPESVRRLLEGALRRYPDDAGLRAFLTLMDFVEKHGIQAVHQNTMPVAPQDAAPLSALAGSDPRQEPATPSAPPAPPKPTPPMISKAVYPDAARTRKPTKIHTRKLKLFCAYTPADEGRWRALSTCLSTLKQENVLEGWQARLIDSEETWKNKLSHHLEEADIVVFLVSTDFLATGYAEDIEARWALDMHRSGRARLIPLIVEQCKWRTSSLSKLSPLPADGRPIAGWKDQKDAWAIVLDGLRERAEALRFR